MNLHIDLTTIPLSYSYTLTSILKGYIRKVRRKFDIPSPTVYKNTHKCSTLGQKRNRKQRGTIIDDDVMPTLVKRVEYSSESDDGDDAMQPSITSLHAAYKLGQPHMMLVKV